MPNPLCPLPFEHLFINNAGILNACCLSYPQYAAKDEFGFEIRDRSVLQNGLKRAWNSSYIQSTRELTTRQLWPEACQTCRSQETAGIRSRRQQELELSKNLVADPEIRTMDLRIGNVCNLACRMCSPFSSVALVQEWSDSKNPKPIEMENSIRAYRNLDWRNWSEISEIWDELFEISSEVHEINFAGGEPFLNLAHVGYLKKLVQAELSPEIRISYNTNLTVIPDWLESVVRNFKNVRIMVSVDGVGKLGEFIRHPLKWDRFESNLHCLDQMKQKLGGNLDVAFNTTVQTYNLFGLTDLLSYLRNSPFRHLPKTTVANLLHNPSYFNIANLPAEIKSLAKIKIENFQNEIQCSDVDVFLSTVLQHMSTESDQKSFAEFQIATEFYDRKRGQNFGSLVPEMEKFFDTPKK